MATNCPKEHGQRVPQNQNQQETIVHAIGGVHPGILKEDEKS